MKEMEILRKFAKDFDVENLSNTVLDEPKFLTWTGSSSRNKHHYGKGGLIKHVYEVVQLCLNNNSYFQKIDDRSLFLAALFHDIGKIYDYKYTKDDLSEWKNGEHKYKIHHITKSAIIWNEAFKKYPSKYLSNSHAEEITHAILAHHCLREWGSPVEPKTHLAWMLHICDQMSARMDDCLTINEK